MKGRTQAFFLPSFCKLDIGLSQVTDDGNVILLEEFQLVTGI